MNHDTLRQAEAIFLEAVAMDPAARAALVERRCGSNDELRRMVLDLLRDHIEADSFLKTPEVVDRFRQAAELDSTTPDATLATGQQIGSFRILSVLGQGGMGVVYCAEQAVPSRIVALKVLRPGMISPTLLRRFNHEVEVLGRLRHAGIAQVFDAGTFDRGHGPEPWFAMELVEGIPLTEYARSRGLGLRERLRLLTRICDAVQHAHEKGVIHRDLKPGNILVNTSGEPKVLDFGIARSTESDIALTSIQTDVGSLLGTLPYMSPEQVSGRPADVDTRTDIYALGVIGYEILTGRLPFDVQGRSLVEAARIISSETAAPLSSIDRALRGDVEVLIGRAMEREPARRYASAAELGADIGRFLNHQPIVARPPSTTYQLRKLVTRHRTAAWLLLTLACVLVGSTITMAVLYQGQRREREKAVLEAEKARGVSDFLSNMLTSMDPEQASGKDVTVREVLVAASRDVAQDLDHNPDVAAALQTAMGRAYLALGLYDEAEGQLRPGLETRRRLHGEGSVEVAESLEEMGHLEIKRGHFAAADSTLGGVLAVRRRLLGERHPEVAATYFLCAAAAYERGNLARSDSLHRIALDIRREGHGENSPEVLASTTNLALAVHGLGRYAEAESLYRRAVDIALARYGEDHPQHAVCLNNLGLLVHDKRTYDEAEVIFRRTLAVRRKAFGDEHPEVAISLNNLARTLRAQRRYEEAVPLYLEAIAIVGKRLGDENPMGQTMRNNLAVVYERMGRRDLAIATYEQVLALMRPAIGPDHPTIATTLNNLGGSLQMDGQFERSATIQLEGLAMARRLYGTEHPDIARALHNIAAVRRGQKQFAEAETLETAGYVMRKKVMGEGHLDIAESAASLANIVLDRGDIPVATGLYREALAIEQARLPAGHWRTAGTESMLGACLTRAGSYAEAESCLVRSHRIMIESPVIEAEQRRVSLERLIRLYSTWGKNSEAARYRGELAGMPR